MPATKAGGQKFKQKMIAKLRQPSDTDEQAEQRFKDYMGNIARKTNSPESYKKSVETKLKKNPNYFKDIGSQSWKNR